MELSTTIRVIYAVNFSIIMSLTPLLYILNHPEIFKIGFNEYNFNQGYLVHEERNYHLNRIKQETYYNLYNKTPDLSFVDKRSWPSYELTEGIHNIIIKANDINKNKIIIFGTIISYPKNKLIYEINESTDSIYILIDENNRTYEYNIELTNKYSGKIIEKIKSDKKKISINIKNIPCPAICALINTSFCDTVDPIP